MAQRLKTSARIVDKSLPALKQMLNVNLERVDYWLSKGALPTNTMHSMIKKARRSAAAKSAAPAST